MRLCDVWPALCRFSASFRVAEPRRKFRYFCYFCRDRHFYLVVLWILSATCWLDLNSATLRYSSRLDLWIE